MTARKRAVKVYKYKIKRTPSGTPYVSKKEVTVKKKRKKS
jgi:hypothetical protein